MTAILLTIPPSHYCEKARWALDRLGWDYRERPMAPPFYMPAVRKAGGKTVPVLIDGDRTLTDSTDILRYLDERAPEDLRLYGHGDPALEGLEKEWNDHLGRHVRRVAYSRMIDRPDLLMATLTDRTPPGQALALRFLMPFLRVGLRQRMGLTEEKAARSREEVERLLAPAEERLADGRPYLGGDRFGAADLTLAALFAPAVLPPEYGSWLPGLGDLDEASRRQVEAYRDRPAGRYVLRLYREERRRRP